MISITISCFVFPIHSFFWLILYQGDEQRYNIFREEAIDALLTPLLCDTNKEACLNATHVLCRIGSSHSQHELESWLLKKAGLASPYRTTPIRTTKVNLKFSFFKTLQCQGYYNIKVESSNTFLIGMQQFNKES